MKKQQTSWGQSLKKQWDIWKTTNYHGGSNIFYAQYNNIMQTNLINETAVFPADQFDIIHDSKETKCKELKQLQNKQFDQPCKQNYA